MRVKINKVMGMVGKAKVGIADDKIMFRLDWKYIREFLKYCNTMRRYKRGW